MAKNSYHGIYFEICHNDIIDDITDARQSTLKLHNFIGAKKKKPINAFSLKQAAVFSVH